MQRRGDRGLWDDDANRIHGDYGGILGYRNRLSRIGIQHGFPGLLFLPEFTRRIVIRLGGCSLQQVVLAITEMKDKAQSSNHCVREEELSSGLEVPRSYVRLHRACKEVPPCGRDGALG